MLVSPSKFNQSNSNPFSLQPQRALYTEGYYVEAGSQLETGHYLQRLYLGLKLDRPWNEASH